MRISDWSSDVCSSDLVAAGGGGVDGDDLLGGEARQVVRAAGLGAGARQALAAEGLYPDHRADLVAVDVDVADPGARGDVLDGLVDARVDAQGKAVRSEEHTSELPSLMRNSYAGFFVKKKK